MIKFSRFDSELEPNNEPIIGRPDAYRGIIYTWGVNTLNGKPILEPHYTVSTSKELVWEMEPGEKVYYIETFDPNLEIVVDWYDSHFSGKLGEVMHISIGGVKLDHVVLKEY